jgi:hypothetical protein
MLAKGTMIQSVGTLAISRVNNGKKWNVIGYGEIYGQPTYVLMSGRAKISHYQYTIDKLIGDTQENRLQIVKKGGEKE